MTSYERTRARYLWMRNIRQALRVAFVVELVAIVVVLESIALGNFVLARTAAIIVVLFVAVTITYALAERRNRHNREDRP